MLDAIESPQPLLDIHSRLKQSILVIYGLDIIRDFAVNTIKEIPVLAEKANSGIKNGSRLVSRHTGKIQILIFIAASPRVDITP